MSKWLHVAPVFRYAEYGVVTDDCLLNNEMIDQRINYIHENPVRAMIVERAEDYLFSSAKNYASLGGIIDVEVVA